MTLHQAMTHVLQGQPRFSASTKLLADQIAKARLYRRRDGQTADARQIAARARRYKHMFRISAPGIIDLIGPE